MTTATWYADIDFVSPRPLTEDDIDDALTKLLDRGGVVSVSRDGSKGGASFTVDAETATEASAVAASTITRTVPGLGQDSIVRLDIRTEEVAQADAEAPSIPDLVGYAEIATLAGVSRQRAREFAEKADFPVAVVETSSGPLRLRTAVERWIAHRKTPTRG
ncbi:hypothetical protein [Pseudactinotalea suaedae]|uniref:hypothetical protein n=1 Tax=Pseudactinotalea suaedae TaxID=1524924 RepID=UPI0012E111A9|nr:hypothetical protein [Pseudactinotalea suaedae]